MSFVNWHDVVHNVQILLVVVIRLSFFSVLVHVHVYNSALSEKKITPFCHHLIELCVGTLASLEV